MAIFFRSYASGSSGNCLALWSEQASVLVDCGLRSKRLARQVLGEHLRLAPPLEGVAITHRHTDHVNRASLQVLSEFRAGVHAHEETLEWVRSKYDTVEVNGQAFSGDGFRVGDFEFEPFQVDHQPGVLTHGYVVRARTNGRAYKLVLVTDFCRCPDLVEHLTDADFVYIESNHDPELLEIHPNYLSRYHLPNETTGEILGAALRRSAWFPRAVVLGHLSAQRNRPELAEWTFRAVLARQGVPIDFPLLVAGRFDATGTIRISD